MRRLPFVRSVVVVASAVVMVMVAYFALVFAQVVRLGSSEPADNVKVDAIVVMGAAQYDGRPSALLQERLERALELWQGGHAQWVAVTGGKKSGDRFDHETGRDLSPAQHDVTDADLSVAQMLAHPVIDGAVATVPTVTVATEEVTLPALFATVTV